MVNPTGRAGSGVDFDKLKAAIRQFSEEWPERPAAIKGRKESIRSSILELNIEVKLLMNKGYTPADVVDALATIGMKVSLNTVKSAFREIRASEEALTKANVKTKKPCNDNKKLASNTTNIKTVVQVPTTAGASKSRSKDV